MKAFATLGVIAVLSLGGYNTAMAQSGPKEETKKAGEATKDAAKDTGSAAKHAGKATANAAKKVTGNAQSGTKEETKKAGQAAKEAGKDTGDAAKHAGKATANVAKKGATSVKGVFTGSAHATCADGSRQSGKTEADAAKACSGHGGVAKH